MQTDRFLRFSLTESFEIVERSVMSLTPACFFLKPSFQSACHVQRVSVKRVVHSVSLARLAAAAVPLQTGLACGMTRGQHRRPSPSCGPCVRAPVACSVRQYISDPQRRCLALHHAAVRAHHVDSAISSSEVERTIQTGRVYA